MDALVVRREHVMSESFDSSEVEPRARWLADLDPARLHAWVVRAVSRLQHDLLPTSPSVPPDLQAREAFIDWCAAGADLFLREGAPLPSRKTIDDAAHRVMLVVVLRRHRSITGAAQALETSRRALRDTMKRLGIYERWKRWAAGERGSTSGEGGSGRSTSEGQGRSAAPVDPSRSTLPLGDPPSVS
jgi:hypothetical protein